MTAEHSVSFGVFFQEAGKAYRFLCGNKGFDLVIMSNYSFLADFQWFCDFFYDASSLIDHLVDTSKKELSRADTIFINRLHEGRLAEEFNAKQ